MCCCLLHVPLLIHIYSLLSPSSLFSFLFSLFSFFPSSLFYLYLYSLLSSLFSLFSLLLTLFVSSSLLFSPSSPFSFLSSLFAFLSSPYSLFSFLLLPLFSLLLFLFSLLSSPRFPFSFSLFSFSSLSLVSLCGPFTLAAISVASTMSTRNAGDCRVPLTSRTTSAPQLKKLEKSVVKSPTKCLTEGPDFFDPLVYSLSASMLSISHCPSKSAPSVVEHGLLVKIFAHTFAAPAPLPTVRAALLSLQSSRTNKGSVAKHFVDELARLVDDRVYWDFAGGDALIEKALQVRKVMPLAKWRPVESKTMIYQILAPALIARRNQRIRRNPPSSSHLFLSSLNHSTTPLSRRSWSG